MDMNFKARNTYVNRMVSNFRLRGATKQRKTFSGHIMNKLYYVLPSHDYQQHPVNNTANFEWLNLFYINRKIPN